MSWTKRQLIEQAFEEIGYASYAYDLETEQLEAGLRRLDSMMATWNGRLIKLGYPLPETQDDSDLDQDSRIPDRANEAVYLSLALRIAPIVGKAVSAETKMSAKLAYNEMLRWAVQPKEMQMPSTMPAGAGNKPWRDDDPFLQPLDDRTIDAPVDTLEFNP